MPIQHAGVNPYGINTFLEQEVEPAKREQQVQMIAEAGFHWIRQEFPWEDIEITARGDFQDRRNRRRRRGRCLGEVRQHRRSGRSSTGWNCEARIDKPPEWTRADPDAHRLHAARQLGRLHQLPDDLRRALQRAHPLLSNLERAEHLPGMGRKRRSIPEAYTQMLCRAYARAQAGRSGERGHQRGALADHRADGARPERVHLLAAHVRRRGEGLLRHHGDAGLRLLQRTDRPAAAPDDAHLRPQPLPARRDGRQRRRRQADLDQRGGLESGRCAGRAGHAAQGRSSAASRRSKPRATCRWPTSARSRNGPGSA